MEQKAICRRNRVRNLLRPTSKVMSSRRQQPGRYLSRLAIRKTESAEATGDAAAAVADVATAAATAVIVVRTEAQKGRPIDPSTEVPTAALNSASLVPSNRCPPARWIPAGTSLQARRPDTSPCCCPENQFPSTSATPSSRRPWSRSVSQSLRSSPNPLPSLSLH